MSLLFGRSATIAAGARRLLSLLKGLSLLRNRSIALKIGAGFGVILVFFLCAGAVTFYALQSASQGFVQYRGIAGSANLLAKVQTDLLDIRDTVKDYLITGSEDALKNYRSHITATRARLASTKAQMDDPERIERLGSVEKKLARYDEAFGQIVELRKKRDHLVKDVIYVNGPQMGDSINDLFQRYQGTKNPEVLYQLGNALKYLNTGRLYASRFLDTGDPTLANSADSELFLFEDYLYALEQLLDTYSLGALEQIKKSLALYKDALSRAVGAVQRQGVLADEIVKSIGPDVAATIGDLTDSIRVQQDSLGPKLVARNASANFLVGALLAAALLLGTLLALYLARAITLPLRRATLVMEGIRLGRLDERVGLTQRDEVGRLSRAIDDFAETLSGFSGLMRRMAGGDFSMEVPLQSADDEMGKAARMMVAGVRSLALGARQAAGQVDAGAGEMLDASQSLSQAATQQAASVEEITSTMQMIGGQARENADNAAKAHELGKEAEDAAKAGVTEMDGMVTAMRELDESSKSIAKIIKVIDGIAFQTNLLALNAAVEAARAGKHGRGFAVVANEVRNLASRSAKAAEETETLIETALRRVDQGTKRADRTARMLDEIVELGHRSAVLVGEIATASEEQARGAAEVGIALDQVQGVTQDNTAQAEEVAAAATELASQARDLRGLIDRFRLGEGGAQPALATPGEIGEPAEEEVPGALPAPGTPDVQLDGWGRTPPALETADDEAGEGSAAASPAEGPDDAETNAVTTDDAEAADAGTDAEDAADGPASEAGEVPEEPADEPEAAEADLAARPDEPETAAGKEPDATSDPEPEAGEEPETTPGAEQAASGREPSGEREELPARDGELIRPDQIIELDEDEFGRY